VIEPILIIGFSLLLLAYWFRYTVLLLLSEEAVERSEAIDSQLSLPETRETLRNPQAELALDRLHRALEKDYRILSYLLDHAAGLRLRPVERTLLMLDYQMLRIWYRLKPNRRALEEMAGILHYIACKMGERAGAPLRAAR
jgi:hypothetical protein